MNAKEYLSRAWHMEQKVQAKLEQIERLRSLVCGMTAGIGGTTGHSRNVTSMQDTIVKIAEMEEELNREIDDLVTVRREIAEVIGQVEDSCQRVILEKRFLVFLSWSRIARDLFYSRTWLVVKRNEAIDAVQRILDEREGDREREN